ncbi:MAG: DDE-type integrase/transposase/recombinase [Oscillospiraceae bacterium]|nr:DDE-type integrase/transposase/recombinase [Oscillospiraceae bacterium]
MVKRQNRTMYKGAVFTMNSITSEAKYRQRVIRYSYKHGVTRAANRFRRSRNAIYEWRAKYDGNWKSLVDKSHRPHSHPKQHTEEEKALIMRHWKHNKDDRIVLWDTLRKKGYTRHYNSLVRVLNKWLPAEQKAKQKARKPKPYERAEYPGQKIQIDVKYVPSDCVANGQKYYQYTAIDECTRVVFREMYDEHSTFSSKDFLEKLMTSFPFQIREAQTDNGTEFTNALLVTKSKHKSLFEQALADMGIIYHRIKIATPQHNGKVERQHRIDGQRFYKKMRMYSLADGRAQLAKYNIRSNNIPKICLGFQSSNQILEKYLGVM